MRLNRFILQAAEEKNVSQALIQDKAETLPDIKKEVHIWEKKYQVNNKNHDTLRGAKNLLTNLSNTCSLFYI